MFRYGSQCLHGTIIGGCMLVQEFGRDESSAGVPLIGVCFIDEIGERGGRSRVAVIPVLLKGFFPQKWAQGPQLRSVLLWLIREPPEEGQARFSQSVCYEVAGGSRRACNGGDKSSTRCEFRDFKKWRMHGKVMLGGFQAKEAGSSPERNCRRVWEKVGCREREVDYYDARF